MAPPELGVVIVKDQLAAGTVKAQNAEFFATDVAPTLTSTTRAASLRLLIALSAAVKIEITLDSGTTWQSINANAAVVAESLYKFDIPIRNGDLFNIRVPDVGGATVRVCRVDESAVEA